MRARVRPAGSGSLAAVPSADGSLGEDAGGGQRALEQQDVGEALLHDEHGGVVGAEVQLPDDAGLVVVKAGAVVVAAGEGEVAERGEREGDARVPRREADA
jgi:hypothetical protein